MPVIDLRAGTIHISADCPDRFIERRMAMIKHVVLGAVAVAAISIAAPAGAEEVGVGVGVGPAGAGVTIGTGHGDRYRDREVIREREYRDRDRDATVVIKRGQARLRSRPQGYYRARALRRFRAKWIRFVKKPSNRDWKRLITDRSPSALNFAETASRAGAALRASIMRRAFVEGPARCFRRPAAALSVQRAGASARRSASTAR